MKNKALEKKVESVGNGLMAMLGKENRESMRQREFGQLERRKSKRMGQRICT